VSERDLQIKETSCGSEVESMAASGLASPTKQKRGRKHESVGDFGNYLLRKFKQT
jgi:hypothetical protein